MRRKVGVKRFPPVACRRHALLHRLGGLIGKVCRRDADRYGVGGCQLLIEIGDKRWPLAQGGFQQRLASRPDYAFTLEPGVKQRIDVVGNQTESLVRLPTANE